MKIRRFYGRDMREALKSVRDELGGDAVIMSNKKVADGVEIVAAYDKEPDAKPKLVKSANSATAQPSAPILKTKKTPTLSEIIGDSGPDSLKALLEKQAQEQQPQATSSTQTHASQRLDRSSSHKPPSSSTSPSSNRSPASTPSESTISPSAIDDIRKELSSLRNVLQFQVSGLLQQQKHRQHPMHGYLVARLEAMGIDSTLAEEVVSYAPGQSDEREAWLFLLKLLANRLSTNGNDILNRPGVVALLGPTGTGKTTTIAKLAAKGAQKYGADQVALVTIDSYRIAAYEQLSTYGKIIGCSVKRTQSAQELSDVLYQQRNKRLVLIDTAGFGQRDKRLIKQLDTFKQESCANIRKYLVMQANSQYQMIEKSIETYQPFALNGCIFTKLDECYSLGEAISAAIKQNLAISYVTDGQKVPEDIKVADAKALISAAAKLYKKFGIPHTGAQTSDVAAMAV